MMKQDVEKDISGAVAIMYPKGVGRHHKAGLQIGVVIQMA